MLQSSKPTANPEMAESELDPSKTLKQTIVDLLVSAGYIGALNEDQSAKDKLIGGLACEVIGKIIEEALRLMKCPYPFRADQIQEVDWSAIDPVVTWIVNRVLTMQAEGADEVTYVLHEIEKEEHTVQQLEKELNHAKNSTEILHVNLNDKKKATILNGMQHLHEKIDKGGANDVVQRLILLLGSLKALEKQESDLRSYCEQKRSDLHAEVIEFEKRITKSKEIKGYSGDLDHSLCDPMEKWRSSKSELAAKLRDVLSLKRQLDDVPSQSELIQYERRFSELYVQIQEKHRQTRKYYATYNALLEIKELVQKETSLLNSISSQFQDAMTSTAGRVKLIDSMEAVLKGTQQKLGKVQLGLQEEQKKCDALKEKYAASIAEQRRCSSLLKALQEEYAKNEKLRSQTFAWRMTHHLSFGIQASVHR
ncbi:Protein of unknown function DUF2037 [Macleaya cordata]|uniref:Uncharacterized protein n=1 Tax=Macleaya cordata TaxID=56857 RepID=A0A200PN64_MACCD|nr:Protein of unknown function DUF2037 [Macleaya cordata]